MTIRTTFQLILVDCSALEEQQLHQRHGPVVERRGPNGDEGIAIFDDESFFSDYSDDSSLYENDSLSSSEWDDDCARLDRNDPSVRALFTAFDELYTDNVVDHTPSEAEASFLASLEERMARNAIRDQGREEDDDQDNDSIVQARRRGIPSMRVSNGRVPQAEQTTAEDDEDSSEIYIAPLAGEDDEQDEQTLTPRARTIPKPRRYTRLYSPRRRNQSARLQV